MYFSCFAKKSTKRRRPRGAELIAHLRAKSRPRRLRSETRLRAQPQSKPPPLETPGAHFRWCWSTLTYILFGQKMFRFFVQMVGKAYIGRADVVEQSAFFRA